MYLECVEDGVDSLCDGAICLQLVSGEHQPARLTGEADVSANRILPHPRLTEFTRRLLYFSQVQVYIYIYLSV